MPLQPLSPAILHCHPRSTPGTIAAVKAFPRLEGRLLIVTFVLKGNIDRLQIPPTAPPRRAHRLWQRTCFEVLVAIKGSSTYYEFNFSPSTQWGAYAFTRYRDGASLEKSSLEPRISVRCEANALELSAAIRLDHLPNVSEARSLRLGLSAIIEDRAGRFSYWALRHPPGNPDFHHPDSFVLHLRRA